MPRQKAPEDQATGETDLTLSRQADKLISLAFSNQGNSRPIG